MWLISELNDGNLAIVWVSYCQQYILFHGVAHLWVAEFWYEFFQYEGHLKQVKIKLHIFEKKMTRRRIGLHVHYAAVRHSYSAFGHLQSCSNQMYVSASQTYSSESRYVRLEAVIGVPKVVGKRNFSLKNEGGGTFKWTEVVHTFD